MTDTRRSLLLLTTTILWACSFAQGAEPNATTPPLTFQDGSMEVPWPPLSLPHTLLPPNPRPKSAAGITLRWPQGVKQPSFPTIDAFFSWAIDANNATTISKAQRAFLGRINSSMAASFTGGRLTADDHRDDPNCYSVLIYAVSPDDAREMARGYLRFMQHEFNRDMKESTDNIQRMNERIAFREKRIPELEELVKTSRASLAELQKVVPYRTNEEASAAMGELDRMLNAARVDIAGIQAKIEAIQGYPQDKRTAAVVSKLEVMFVEEAISLRAAEARKREATELRGQAAKFIDSNKAVADALPYINLYTDEHQNMIQALVELNADLAQLKQCEPQVLDSTVFIYPVRVRD